ncbi:hypothetical protein HGRIS_000406 [Hohenbuehelia grisea]|uniref:DUF6534 domain-containing protein n=1 Tax=Hohenbuehelia grisea TaxID=104357 RepID=A0ABR3JSJ1_9AGAR
MLCPSLTMPPVLELDTANTIGPLVLGYLLETLLFGVLAMQVYSYHVTFPKDHLMNKLAVRTAFSLEFLVNIFAMISAWHTLGAGWGNIDALTMHHWAQTPISICSPLADCIVQAFFAFRIYRLTKRLLVPVVISLLSLLAVVLGCYAGIKLTVDDLPGFGDRQTYNIITVALAADALCDTIIAATTVFLLAQAQKQTQFKKTKMTLQRLIILSVETGTITASCAVLDLVLSRTNTGSYFQIFSFIGDKFYVIAMMASLNSRASRFNQLPDFIGMSDIETSDASVRFAHRPTYPTLFDDEYEEQRTDVDQRASTKSPVVNVTRSIVLTRDTPSPFENPGYPQELKPEPKRSGCRPTVLE